MANRLTIINDALLATGNEPRNQEYDGSAEWIVADSAYRRAVQHLLSKHVWNFATTTVPLASVVLATPSALRGFAYGYVLPADCLHVEGVFLNGHPFTDYEIVDQKICSRFGTGLVVKYVRAPIVEDWPAGFVELLTLKVEANLLRGLNEDTDNADKRDGAVKNELNEFRAFSDEQEGRTAALNSRSLSARRGYGRSRGGRC